MREGGKGMRSWQHVPVKGAGWRGKEVEAKKTTRKKSTGEKSEKATGKKAKNFF